MSDEPGVVHGPSAPAEPEVPSGPSLSSEDFPDGYALAASDWVAAATDRGLRKVVNQDAVRVAARDEAGATAAAVLVVSDGVSTSLGSGAAASTAAESACGTLADFLAGTPSPTRDDIEGAMDAAFAEARARVLEVGPGEPTGSCTLIAAVVGPHGLTVANVGDCRGYWVGDTGPALCLSVDDSVAQARILMGIPREEAERGFQAHAITNWLGPDTPSGRPGLQWFAPREPGWLVLCSDGLWNYASEAEDFAGLVRGAAAGTATPVDLAIRLVEWANEEGGHDNISVALARVAAGATDSPPPARDDAR